MGTRMLAAPIPGHTAAPTPATYTGSSERTAARTALSSPTILPPSVGLLFLSHLIPIER